MVHSTAHASAGQLARAATTPTLSRAVPTLRSFVVQRAALTSSERARMFALMELCYDNVDLARFNADLDNKQAVIVLRDRAGTLQGFSTVRLAAETVAGRRVRVVFSGDTVIHPDFWGTKALQRAFVTLVVKERLREPRVPLYWLLLTKGYRTYLLLTNQFPACFPRAHRATDPVLKEIRDSIAARWWGPAFNADTGILHYATPHDRVKTNVAPVDDVTGQNPDVAFFLKQNPGSSDGDELVCVAAVTLGLPLRFAWKQLRRRLGFAPRSRDARP